MSIIFVIGARVRVKSGTCQGWCGTVTRVERVLQGERPAPGREYPLRYRLRFGGATTDCGFFDSAELEAA